MTAKELIEQLSKVAPETEIIGEGYGRVRDDKKVMCRLTQILHMHRSKEWKKERLYGILTEFVSTTDSE